MLLRSVLNRYRLVSGCSWIGFPKGLDCQSRTCFPVHRRCLDSVSTIKQLRKVTKGGVAECKKALVKSNWDLDAAILYIRQKQQSGNEEIDAAKPIYGKIALSSNILSATGSVVVELNCNCDFITSSEEYLRLSQNVRKAIQRHVEENCILAEGDSSGGLVILNSDMCNEAVYDQHEGITVGQMIKRLSGEYKRAIAITNALCFNPLQKFYYPGLYVHKKVEDDDGTTGERVALVNMKCVSEKVNSDKRVDQYLRKLAKAIAVQLVANTPKNVNEDSSNAAHGATQLMEQFMGQTWLQPEQTVSTLGDICEILGVTLPDIKTDITMHHTLKILAEVMSTDKINVEVAVYMKAGERMLVLRQ